MNAHAERFNRTIQEEYQEEYIDDHEGMNSLTQNSSTSA